MSITSIKGMHDIYSEEAELFDWVIGRMQEMATRFSFEKLYPPIVESSDLYVRNLGTETDIISKEIYAFCDRGGNNLALRPEFTAGVARSIIEKGLFKKSMPLKLFSYGPLFRYDRPQKGRYRQFNQFNFEIVGVGDLEYNILILEIVRTLLNCIGVDINKNNWTLKINFVADEKTRAEYKADLISFMDQFVDELSPDSQRRLKKNPLRVLDSKDPRDLKIINNVPKINKYYSPEYRIKIDKTIEILDQLGFSYELDYCLVRGMDYYDDLVFEVVSGKVDSAQNSILGGGVYSRLMKEISEGRFNVSSIGFAGGIERLMMIDEVKETFERSCADLRKKTLKLVVIPETESSLAFALSVFKGILLLKSEKNKNNIIVDIELKKRSIVKTIKKIKSLDVDFAILCKKDKSSEETIAIKDLSQNESDKICANFIDAEKYLANILLKKLS